MRVLMVLFVLWVCIACKKEKCYDCYQKIEITTNKDIPGYPLKSKTKIVSCGGNPIIDNPSPIIITDTIGDTIWTYWKDTDCFEQKLF
jgi:hypothetical protein